jgi:phage I-like protein
MSTAIQIAVPLSSKSDGANGPVWIQIARVGQWHGHPSGPFQLGAKEFREIVDNFKATRNKSVPIDFEHASELDAREGSIPISGAPAQGWIIDLDNRGEGGLWALVAWLEPARTYIKEGKYKYFSPTLRFNPKDPETGARRGCRLSSGALTNQPFLDGMAPLAARDTAEETDMHEDNDTPVVSIQAVAALASRYTERLVSEGHHPAKARQLAMARAGREIVMAMNAQSSEIEQLAGKVRAGEASIVQLKIKIASERRGIGDGQAWVEAERMIRSVDDSGCSTRTARLSASGDGHEPEGIVALANRLQKETPGLDRERAFVRAEKQLRA